MSDDNKPTTDEVEISVINGAPAPVPSVEDDAPGGGGFAPAAAAPGASPDAAPQTFRVETVSKTVAAGYRLIAQRRGPHWNVTPAEADMIAQPLTEELNELAARFPVLGGAAGVVDNRAARLAIAVSLVTGPRLVADYQIAAARAAQMREQVQRERAAERRDDAPPRPAASGFGSLLDETPRPEG